MDVQGALDAWIDAIFFNESNQVANHIKQVNHLLELKIFINMKRHS
jgi:putative hydrolase of the HAD superfamily